MSTRAETGGMYFPITYQIQYKYLPLVALYNSSFPTSNFLDMKGFLTLELKHTQLFAMYAGLISSTQTYYL